MTIKLMVTAGFAHVVESDNVERFLAKPHHATLNGTNWSYRVIDTEKPAHIKGEATYQFGAPQKFHIVWDGVHWRRADGRGHADVCGEVYMVG